MKHLLKTITEPTNIYIVGTSFTHREPPITVMYTDDYSGHSVCNGEEMIDVCNEGGFSLYTEEEMQLALLELYSWFETNPDYYDQDTVVLPNYVGNIYVDLVDENNESVLKANPNLTYLRDQYEEERENDYYNMVVDVAPRAEIEETNINAVVLKLLNNGNRNGEKVPS